MRVLMLTKHKRSACEALACLAKKCDVAYVAPPATAAVHLTQRVDLAALEYGARAITEDATTSEPFDLVVSFLWGKRIKEPLLSHGRLGCVNFHPAPLPDFRGYGGISFAILEGLREWGVSAHYVDPTIDTGDLIECQRFPINPHGATALTLDVTTQHFLAGLVRPVRDAFLSGTPPKRIRQDGPARYISVKEWEAARVVRPGDDVERKARAFWYPPHGSAIRVLDDGSTVPVVPERAAALGCAAIP